VEEPDRREANEDAVQGSNDQDERERADGSSEKDPKITAEEIEGDEVDVGAAGSGELQRRLEAKDQHIRELYDELAAARLVADEAVAKAEAGALRVGDLEEERAQLQERVRTLEEEELGWRRWREGQDRLVARLEREIERREAEIGGLEDLLERSKGEMEVYAQEAQDVISRKDAALEDALKRVEGLQHDLEERENEAAELRAAVDKLRAELDLEYELRQRMADPANRLREGIDLFNDSEHLQTVGSISKSLGPPEVHAALGDGGEPPVILTFTWEDIAWRTYHADPAPAVKEPRIYLESTGDDLSGMDLKPSNAHIGPDGRVVLGL